jgi:hypothetical protein
MEEIIYNDNIIHVFNDGHIAVYTMDADGDIHEDWCPSIEAAKRIIDRHIQDMNDNEYAEEENEIRNTDIMFVKALYYLTYKANVTQLDSMNWDVLRKGFAEYIENQKNVNTEDEQ